jgi:hypothetical protein
MASHNVPPCVSSTLMLDNGKGKPNITAENVCSENSPVNRSIVPGMVNSPRKAERFVLERRVFENTVSHTNHTKGKRLLRIKRIQSEKRLRVRFIVVYLHLLWLVGPDLPQKGVCNGGVPWVWKDPNRAGLEPWQRLQVTGDYRLGTSARISQLAY